MKQRETRGMQLPEFEKLLGKRIMPLYKSEPPYMKFEGGFGYLGVMLIDNLTDNVQCHFCGWWFKSVSNHVRGHGMTSAEYRMKVGLYKSASMMGIQALKRFSNATKKAGTWQKNLAKGSATIRQHSPKKNTGNYTYQHKNKWGTCEEQLKSRLLKAIEKHGKIKIVSEELSLYNALKRRFGSYDEAIKYYGISKLTFLEKVRLMTRIVTK